MGLLIHFAVQKKLTQHCKSTILQKKINYKKKKKWGLIPPSLEHRSSKGSWRCFSFRVWAPVVLLPMLLWNGLRHVVVEGKYEKRRGGASLSQSMMRVLLLSEPELEVFSWSPFCYPVLTSSLARNIGGKQYQSYYQVNDALHCGLLLQSVCVCVCVCAGLSVVSDSLWLHGL